jgi:hypothetical protein
MKKNLRKKIIVGVCTAAFMSQQAFVFAGTTPQAGQMANAQMTSDEQAFSDKLSGSARDQFMKMSQDDRSMAMKMANHDCKAANSCKGQGGCKTANECKAMGKCKSTPAQAVMRVNARKTG